MKSHRNANKFIIAICILVVLLAVIWFMPMKSRSVNVEFLTNSMVEGVITQVEIYSDNAYTNPYVFESAVTEGKLTFKLEQEYIPVDHIIISNEKVAQSIYSMQVLSDGFKFGEYVTTVLDNDIFESNDNGYLSEKAISTIAKGIENPRQVRSILCYVVAFFFLEWLIYNLIKIKAGTFKAALISIMVFMSGAYLFVVKIKGFLDKEITLKGNVIKNETLVIDIVLFFVLLISICILVNEKSKWAGRVIIGIYIAILFFSICRITFYSEKVANTPDEVVHIGYIACLEKSNRIFPDFEEMMPTPVNVYSNGEEMQLKFINDSITNLKHPPLYYHLMRLAKGITFNEDESVDINLDRLRYFSAGFVILSLMLLFYIGYTRIKKVPLYHLLYSIICTNVPMMLYCAGGVNNDSLTLLTVTIFLLGMLRYLEKKRNLLTYLLIGIGISFTLLTKLTAGIVVVVAGLVVLISTTFKEKSYKELISRSFLMSLPLYILPAIYFLYMLKTVGSFQPNMFTIKPEYARTSGFYIPIGERAAKSVFEYIQYFISSFMKTWTGVASHISLVKVEESWFSVQNIAMVSLWFLPFLMFIKPIREKTKYASGLIATHIAVLLTVILQVYNGYNVYTTRGYLGGFQSRYYICVIGFFAFCIVLLVQKAMEALENQGVYAVIIQKVIISAVVVFMGLMVFEDFVYFLVYYNNYII